MIHLTPPQTWAILILAGFIAIAAFGWFAWSVTTPRGRHFHHDAGEREVEYPIEPAWLNEDQLRDAIWHQTNLKFDEAVSAYLRVTDRLVAALSPGGKSAVAGPMVTSSKSKASGLVVDVLVAGADDAMADLEILFSWAADHGGKRAMVKVMEAAANVSTNG